MFNVYLFDSNCKYIGYLYYCKLWTLLGSESKTGVK